MNITPQARALIRKYELHFYKSWFGKFRLLDLIPKISFCKSIQGWHYIISFSINFFTYSLTFFITKSSNTDENRHIAHEKNIIKYE